VRRRRPDWAATGFFEQLDLGGLGSFVLLASGFLATVLLALYAWKSLNGLLKEGLKSPAAASGFPSEAHAARLIGAVKSGDVTAVKDLLVAITEKRGEANGLVQRSALL
jgi:hypothetical protein